MPRGRGGARVGTPGQAYSNRSDLTKAPSIHQQTVATGQPYGVATAQQNQLKAVPLPTAQPPAAPPPSPMPPPGGPQVLPGQLGDLHAPTDRPNEPVTAGLPSGAGPGPEALQGQGQSQNADLLNQLRGAYLAHPNEDLRQLIAQMGMSQP